MSEDIDHPLARPRDVDAMTIPARAHFIWIGPHLPWAYAFAVLSAAERGGLDEVVLHHSDALSPGPERAALEACAHVRLRRIDPLDLVARAGADIGIAEPLGEVYRRLGSAVAKTNILRAAILYLEGGIYLDLDTITVRSLAPLLDAQQFVGCEHIVWPGFVRRSRSPWPWARSLLLDVLRKPMRRVAPGWRWFRFIERFYYRGINGAILGAGVGSPLLAQYLSAMTEVPVARQTRPHVLGTNLLQDVVAGYVGGDLVIHEPQVFYPLAPEISEHWFRPRRRIDLSAVLLPATRVVHWYASVRTRSLVDLWTQPTSRLIGTTSSTARWSAAVCPH
jgi:Glycosyltransferase sugar-binding region containing DXD motif.